MSNTQSEGVALDRLMWFFGYSYGEDRTTDRGAIERSMSVSTHSRY